MSRCMRWTDREDEAIRTFYPIVGGRWKGWAKLMPDRMPSYDSVIHRAGALGVRCDSRFRYGKGKSKAEKIADAMFEKQSRQVV